MYMYIAEFAGERILKIGQFDEVITETWWLTFWTALYMCL